MQLRLILPACLLAGILPLAAGESAKPQFPPPPRLAINADELAATQARPDFEALKKSTLDAADPLVKNPVALPDGFGSWVFYYACADDGASLRANSPTDHECPKCKKHYSDERTLAAYRGILHSSAEQAALKLAWAYAYSNDERYASQTKRILIKFADDYPTYPDRLDRWGRTGILAPLGGRRRVQSLEEAEGIIPLAKAYDLTRNSNAWSDTERQHVEKSLFRLTAETLLRGPMGLQNRQAWYNAGLMAIASVLADETLVDKALNGAGGFFDQLQRGVGDDGMWWEGTMAYQSYVVQPMIQTVESARRMGIQLQDHPRFIKFLKSPLSATYPDGTFPCVNDSDPASFHMFNYSFEWAWKTYKDPLFAQALAWRNSEKLKAMLGAGATPVNPLEEQSVNLSSIGLLFLRAGRGADAVCVAHHYGSPGGDATGHAHYDKLNITLFANGREWLADIGRIGYTHKEYKSWAKRTIAHNTVALNQIDQLVNTGKLLWFKSGDGFAACASESTKSYPNTTLRRYLYLTPSMLIDVFDVISENATTIDLAAHAITDPIISAEKLAFEKVASLGNDNGYQHLANVLEWKTPLNSGWILSSGPAGPKLQLHLAAVPGEKIYTGIGIGYSPTQSAPFLIRRRAGPRSRFACVYDLSGKRTYIQKLECIGEDAPHVRVYTTDGTLNFKFDDAGVSTSP
jgi:oligo-alginate lyase